MKKIIVASCAFFLLAGCGGQDQSMKKNPSVEKTGTGIVTPAQKSGEQPVIPVSELSIIKNTAVTTDKQAYAFNNGTSENMVFTVSQDWQAATITLSDLPACVTGVEVVKPTNATWNISKSSGIKNGRYVVLLDDATLQTGRKELITLRLISSNPITTSWKYQAMLNKGEGEQKANPVEIKMVVTTPEKVKRQ